MCLLGLYGIKICDFPTAPFFLLFAEIIGGNVILAPEHFVKVADTLEAAGIADLQNGGIGVEQQVGGVVDPQVVDVFCGGDAIIFLQTPGQVLTAFMAEADHPVDAGRKIVRMLHAAEQLGKPKGCGVFLFAGDGVKKAHKNICQNGPHAKL